MTTDLDRSFDNPLDRMLERWCSGIYESPPRSLAHISDDDRRVLAAIASFWQGTMDPHGQGINHCAHTSYIVRHLLEQVAEVEAEPVTVTVAVQTPSGASATLGNRNPRVRTLDNGYKSWTGHEVVYVPRWSVMLDLTIGQVSQSHPSLSAALIEPVAAELSQAPRPGDAFPVPLSGISNGHSTGSATYVVCRPNYSYREVKQWPLQQAELDRGVANGAHYLSMLGFGRGGGSRV